MESFDDLIAMLDDQTPDNAVEGILAYKLKKGSKTRVFDWTEPGVVTGSVEETFSIKA